MSIMMAAMLVTACGHRASQAGGADTGDSISVDSTAAFSVDSIGLVREDTMVSVKVSIDWPNGGNEQLSNSIRKYICETIAASITLEGQPDVKFYDTGNAAVEATVRGQYDELMSMRKEGENDGASYDGMQFSYYMRIFKFEETDTYVTYLSNYEGYQGGAHGAATSAGQTFRKSDGLRIGYDTEFDVESETFKTKDQTLFSQPQSPELAKLIKEGVRSYFSDDMGSAVSDNQLKEGLISVSDIDKIPLPTNPPYFTANGLTFVYQQYEIAPYAAGMINFDIPYDKVLPFLTPEAKGLIK